MAAPRPTVVLLSLDKEPWHHGMMGHLLSAIKSRATLIDVENKATAIEALAANPHAVLVADAAIADQRNSDFAKKLANYARNGGTVVMGCMMSNFARPPQFDALLKDIWKMPWRFGDYTRDESILNAWALVPKLAEPTKTTLPLAVNVKAVYLMETAKADRVYTPRTYAPGQASVALARYGAGYLGWVGDVNIQEEVDAVYLSLLLDAKRPTSEDNDDG